VHSPEQIKDDRLAAERVLHTGAPWRDMPERYGNWNSVFVRFTSGLLDLLLLALAWSEGVGYSKKVKLGGHADGSPPWVDRV